MKTEKILLATTIAAAARLGHLRFVSFAGATPAAGERVLGVANAEYEAGEQAGVNARGELLIEAGAAITAGAEVQTDAQGRAVPKTTGVVAGEARDAAVAAGEIIRILR